MKIIQSRTFERKTKRFKKQEKKILDKEIRRIVKDPSLGEEKKGELQGVSVHKFKVHNIQYLLSYRIAGDNLELIQAFSGSSLEALEHAPLPPRKEGCSLLTE